MPWYYAGPEAKPVGPVTLEELQALRARGTVAPETYVIEEKGQGMAGLAWKRYHSAIVRRCMPINFTACYIETRQIGC